MAMSSESRDPERIVPGTVDWKLGYGDHIQRYRFAGRWVEGRRVLDAGCGVGYGASLLSDAGAREVVAVDISDQALAIARERFDRDNVTLVCDDCETLAHLAADGGFEVIVAMESIEHFERPDAFLARCVELLAPDGVFICSTPNSLRTAKRPDGSPANPYHVWEYTEEEFRRLLSRYFQTVRIYHQCKTSAYLSRMQMIQVLVRLSTNPTARLGWQLQRVLRGLPPPAMDSWPPPGESDYEIQEFTTEPGETFTFLAVCKHGSEASRRGPRVPG